MPNRCLSAHWRYSRECWVPTIPLLHFHSPIWHFFITSRDAADAEPLLKRALAIREKVLGPNHPDAGVSLNNLAVLYAAQSRYADALPLVQRTISQNRTRKPVAFAILYGSQSENLISPKQALDASYAVLQRSVSSAAGEAVSKLATRFAAGTDELSQFVRKDQDLAAEADRLDKSIVTAVSKPPVERNQAMEDQIQKRIGEIKSERNALLEVFKQRFPDYVALSKPEPLTVEETQTLLADDEAVVTIDLDQKSYVWVITKDRAEWKELSVSAEDVSKEVETLRTGLNPNCWRPFNPNLAYQLYRQMLGPCMSSEHFRHSVWQFKRVSGSSGLKVQAAIAC